MDPEDRKTPQKRSNRGKILVIEGDQANWQIMQQALLTVLPRVRLEFAANGQQALALLEINRKVYNGLPQLILLDLFLPTREDGWETLERIRLMPSAVNFLPVLMLSHSSAAGDIVSSYERGVNSYLLKPQSYAQWVSHFEGIRDYWWEMVTLPDLTAEGF